MSGATTYGNIIEPFLENVERHPQRVACVCGEITQTYEQLDTLACKIARAFRNRGVETGDKVAYLMENSVELIAVYLAIQRIGAVAVPLNYRLIPREIAYLTNAVDAKLLVFAKKFEEKVVESRRDFNPELDLLAVGASTPFAPRLFDLSEPAEPDLELFRDEGALSRVQFTGAQPAFRKAHAVLMGRIWRKFGLFCARTPCSKWITLSSLSNVRLSTMVAIAGSCVPFRLAQRSSFAGSSMRAPCSTKSMSMG